MDPTSWWYYFNKLDGNLVSCKHCDWSRDRGISKPTSILKNHLRTCINNNTSICSTPNLQQEKTIQKQKIFSNQSKDLTATELRLRFSVPRSGNGARGERNG